MALLGWLTLGLFLLYLGSGLTRVAPHESALIYRLGRLQPGIHPPGLVFAWPAPIDRVVKVPTGTQHELRLNAWGPGDEPAPAASTVPAGTRAPRPANLHPVYDGYTLTGDANLVQAVFSVRYRIVDPAAWLRATPPDRFPILLEGILHAVATDALAGLTIDAALGPGIEPFRSRVLTLAQSRLDRLGLGIALTAFDVAQLAPPAATASAFAEVTSAQVEARTVVENARTWRAQTLPQAQSEAYRLRRGAEAAAGQLTARASAEAASFSALVAAYQAAPEAVTARLRADTLSAVLARVKTRTVLPAGEGHLNLFLRTSP
jgi:regulator of protease activity HflC (stomatin/prohibitin superfamily)